MIIFAFAALIRLILCRTPQTPGSKSVAMGRTEHAFFMTTRTKEILRGVYPERTTKVRLDQCESFRHVGYSVNFTQR